MSEPPYSEASKGRFRRGQDLVYGLDTQNLFSVAETDEFEHLLRSPSSSESELQRFFERNPKFLYLLGLYDAHRAQVKIPANLSEIISDRDLRPDFLLYSSKQDLWDIVELKRVVIDPGLVVGTPGRRRFGNQDRKPSRRYAHTSKFWMTAAKEVLRQRWYSDRVPTRVHPDWFQRGSQPRRKAATRTGPPARDRNRPL
jgi:hypothetical protein